MGKRARKTRTVVDTLIPVYIPTEDGYGELELGKAQVKGNTLIIEFNDKLPSVAIQNRIARGSIVGVTFVIPPEEAEEARVAELVREMESEEDDIGLVPETEEEERIRKAEEERQAEIDQVFLDEELKRLEE